MKLITMNKVLLCERTPKESIPSRDIEVDECRPRLIRRKGIIGCNVLSLIIIESQCYFYSSYLFCFNNMGNYKGVSLTKKATRKVFKSDQDFYITSKSSFEAQVKNITDIFNSGEKEIYLHCLGSSINRCLNLALHIINNSGNRLSYSIHTSTIKLIDESHPLHEHEDVALRARNNSAVHIKLFRHLP